MAMGNELVFVLDPEPLFAMLAPDARAEIDTDPDWADDPRGRRYVLVGEVDALLGPRLRAVHAALLQARFGPVTSAQEDGRGRLLASTPAGPRGFSPLGIGQFGLEGAASPRIGISIWGRYAPVWADWRHMHGGSGWDITLSAELLAMSQEARVALTPVVPQVAHAPLSVIECFY